MMKFLSVWFIAILLAFPAATRGADMADVLALIPTDAQSFLAAPNLDTASDAAHVTLHSMDRGQLILGNRPVDVLKSLLGVSSAVEEHAPAAIVVMALDADDIMHGVLWIVPVTNPELFLKANFEPGPEPGTVVGIGQTVFHAREHGRWMVLGEDGDLVTSYAPSPDAAARWMERIGGGTDHLKPSHLLWYGSANAIQFAMRTAEVDRSIAALLATAEDMFIGLEFDPLAIIGRELVQFPAESAMWKHSAGGAQSSAMLAHVPDRPFMVAGSVDMQGLGGRAAVDARLARMGWPLLPGWLDRVQAIHFISQAVDAPPLLANTAMVIKSDRPGHIVEALRAEVEFAGQAADGIERTAVWREGQSKGGVDEVSGFAVRAASIPPERSYLDAILPWLAARPAAPPERLAVESAIGMVGIGPQGITGMVARRQDAAIVILGNNERLLADTVRGGGDSLADSFITATMRQWMPAEADIELYMNPGLIRSALAQSRLLATIAEQIPEFDPNQPPVGVAIDVGGGTIRSSIVVPNSQVVVVLDAMIDRMKATGPGVTP